MELYELLQENFKDNIELLLKLEKIKDLLDNPEININEKLNEIQLTDEDKIKLINSLREKTSKYIYHHIPYYRQTNFTSAKVNALFILLNNDVADKIKQNVKNILRQIRDVEIWITNIIIKYEKIKQQIINSDINTAIDIYNNFLKEYESIPKPQFLESKDIGYIQQVWFSLQI
jgi:DNA-binding protein H-NS